MHVRFLLGPAGSGKTWRCLAEARTELLRDPAGPPLLFLAPKQATYQVERQLLADPELPGFTRLRIVSLDRLAMELLEDARTPLRLLSEEGRIMVLRALLAQHQASLETFRATARLIGFARQLSLTLRDCRRAQLSPARLRRRAEAVDTGLAGKLRDCALLLEHYERWLQHHGLSDPDALMDSAMDVLTTWTPTVARPESRRIHRLWLDGFAEMTPQELSFLSALLQQTRDATLAFCLPRSPSAERPRFDPWTLVAATYGSLLNRLQNLPGIELSVEHLPTDDAHTRFACSPELTHLEQHWAHPVPFSAPAPAAVEWFACPHPEAEAVQAAREILTHVQRGGRFREAAILVRSLDPYHAVLQRVLRRYGIPFFLDQRESITHHPLAELARYSLRVLAYGWRHEDWFGALKTGLLPAGPDEVDLLENESLARGWEGSVWVHPLEIPGDPHLAHQLEILRQRIVSPLLGLQDALGGAENSLAATGESLSRALIDTWHQLGVPAQLESWANLAPQGSRFPAVHGAAWEQILSWADNLALAFGALPLRLQEWLPIVESGLAGLSVGVIPPALDQVLVGAMDRSRNPNLKLAIVLGLNEGSFPATPTHPGLLTEIEHRQLESLGARIGTDSRLQLAHERYYGYIAFTRPSSRLVLTWSERDSEDQPRLPSPFIAHLERLFPHRSAGRFAGLEKPETALHPCELLAPTLAALRARHPEAAQFQALVAPPDSPRRHRLDRLATYSADDSLQPASAARLHGPVLRGSVSALERFAACPFRYFVAHGLRAEERRTLALDSREQGSFQHEALSRFHQELSAESKRWRDLNPAEARVRIRQAAERTALEFHEGLFCSAPGAAFTARALTAALEDFVEVTTRWMTSYAFDPAAVELAFGTRDGRMPPWTLPLDGDRRLELHGKIDRIDLAPSPETGITQAVILDYKSGQQTLDPLLVEHGVQLQLLAYLAVLRGSAALAQTLGHPRLQPVGVFYVGLRGDAPKARHRGDALTDPEAIRQAAYQHRGRYRIDALPLLDSGAPGLPSGQFHYRFTKAGRPDARARDLLTAEALVELLDSIEHHLQSMGLRILEGDIRIDPYQHGRLKACDRCDYRSICRIDPWTHPYRVLRSASPETSDESTPA